MSPSLPPLTRQRVLLENRPLLTEAPSKRLFDQQFPTGVKTGMFCAGNTVQQVFTEDIVTLDASTGRQAETSLTMPVTGGNYHKSSADPDGNVYFVNMEQTKVMKGREGKVEVLAEVGTQNKGYITSDATWAPDGRVLFGTADSKVMAVLPDGTRQEILTMPPGPGGWGSFQFPYRVLPGPEGTLYIGTQEGVACFAPDGSPEWTARNHAVRGGASSFLLSGDGSRLVHTGGEGRMVCVDTATGREAWVLQIPAEDGDFLSQGALDGQGNLYVVSGQGTVIKVSPEGRISWKRQMGTGQQADSLGARVALDADGNVCVTPNAERFQVYSPDGVNLLDLQGPERLEGASEVSDFTLNGDRHKAMLLVRRSAEAGYRVLEIGLPGPASALLAALPDETQQAPGTIAAGEQEVRIGDVTLPRRS